MQSHFGIAATLFVSWSFGFYLGLLLPARLRTAAAQLMRGERNQNRATIGARKSSFVCGVYSICSAKVIVAEIEE